MTHKYCSKCKQTKTLDEFGRTFDKSTNQHYVRHRCKMCLNQEQKDYATKLGSAYREQRRTIKQKRKADDPVKFLVQERIAQWRKIDPASDLTTDYLIKLWVKQAGLCYYTGLPMVPGGLRYPTPDCASLDKLDPARGYKQGNVVWACYQSNTSKGARTEEDFYDFCRLVLSRASERQML